MIRNLLLNHNNLDELAVMDGDKPYTYRDLTVLAGAVQAQLIQLQDEHIAVLLLDSAAFIAAFWGILMAGKTAFPLNTTLTAYEISPLLVQASIHTVVTAEEFVPLLRQISEQEDIPLKLICLEQLEKQGCEPVMVPTIDSGEKMLLLATSGTTGGAKIVCLSEQNMAACAEGYLDKMDFEQYDKNRIRYILGTPFNSAYALMIMTACFVQSFPIIIIKSPFSLERFYHAVERHKVTHYEGGTAVALLMEQMAGRANPYDISTLRYVGFGGSKLSAETIKKLFKAYPGTVFWPGYGMTEASPLIAKPYRKLNMDKTEAVGTAIKGLEIRVDVDGVLLDTPNIEGEIVVKGPNVMLGYYQNREATDQIRKNGWLYTGDIGYLDEDGWLYICGRKKNVIMARGFSVYAEEVEAVFLNSGMVKDCIVYGGTNSFGNEIVCADIVPLNPEFQQQQLYDYCKSCLAAYKQPQKISIVSSLKKTATNKVKRTKKESSVCS